MKKLLTLIIATLLLIGCSKEPKLTIKEKAKTLIEEKIKTTLDDPSSYKFVELSKLDTVYKKDFFLKLKDESEKALVDYYGDYPEKISKQEQLAVDLRKKGKKYESDALKAEATLKKLQNEINNAKKNLEKFKQLYENAKEKEVLKVETYLTCRVNNKFGSNILTKYYVVFNGDQTITYFRQV